MQNIQLDSVTQLYTRPYLFAELERMCLYAARKESQFAVLLIDIDDLKPINDNNGLNVGELFIQTVARAIQRVAMTHSVARFGGDEFVVLAARANLETALRLAENIRAQVAAETVEYQGRIVGSTSVTLGVSCFPDDGETATQLLEEADLAVAIGKNHGKNCVLPARNPHRREAPPY